MNNFYFKNPTKLLFGKGMVDKLPAELMSISCKRVLILIGEGSAKRTGLYNHVIQMLNDNKIDSYTIEGIKPNPDIHSIEQAILHSKEFNPHALLAIGGGSVIDSGKVVAVGHYYEGTAWDLFTKDISTDQALPVYTILTASGTASEMNPTAVVTNESLNKKLSFAAGELTYPKVSIIDPELQYTLPPGQTVNGAIDSITHVLEYYFNGVQNVDIQDRISESLVMNIIKHVRILLKDPENYNSRSQIALSSTLAFNGINSMGRFGGDFATHIMEHALSGMHPHIAHAQGLAVLHPHWMDYVYSVDPQKFKQLEENVFGLSNKTINDSICHVATTFRNLYRELGAPVRLRDLGVQKKDIMEIAENSVMEGPIGKFHLLEQEDIINILNNAY